MKKLISIIFSIVVILTSFAYLGGINGERTLDGDNHPPLYINLKAARFDPLFEQPNIPSHLTYSKENDYYLVQCEGPIQQEWIRAILDSGAIILGYIPDYTYIIYMQQEEKENIIDLPFIRWTGNYHPAYKIDQVLLSKQGQIQLNVMVFQENNDLENLRLVREEISTLGGTIVNKGDYNFIIQTKIDASKIDEIAFIPEVEWIDEYSPPVSYMDNIRVFTGAESPLHEYGFNGTGIVGEVQDNGIDQDHPEFEGQLIATDGDPPEESHGTSTFGIVFAKGVNEQAMGMLPGAEGVFCYWGVGRKQSVANMVNIWGGLFQSNSWGSASSDGVYGSVTRDNDESVFEYDVTTLWATGNGGGDETIARDATAKNVISVGALSHYDNQDRTDDQHTGSQGNKGPTADGRIKPDIVGPYDSIYTTTSGGGYTSGFGGTSGATPVVAGATGLVYEMYRENHFGNNPSGDYPHAATVKAILIADAYQYEFSQGDRYAQGWGLVDVGNVYFIGENHLIDDESKSLQTGESKSYKIEPTGIHPLKISLVWTDVPGTTSSSQHLVNDINLKVTDPDGLVYWGNYGLETSKWSSSEGSADSLNNVENVFIENPIRGEWSIEVIADNIAMDGNIDTPEVDQGFALVASGIKAVDHDMVVSDMEELPRYFKLGEKAVVNGTISNIGFENEANVIVNLLEDGVVVDTQIIGSIQSGTSIQISMSWIPETEKTSNVSIEVPLIVGEERAENNRKVMSVDLFAPLGMVLVDESHGNALNYDTFYEHLYSLKYPTRAITTSITPGKLAGYNILVSARATTDYTSSEQTAIRTFVGNGGGLFIIGDDSQAIYNGLTDYAGIMWNTPRGVGQTVTDINPHNITEDVNEMFFGSPNLILEIQQPAEEIVYDNSLVISRPLVGVSEFENGKIVALTDDNCLDNNNIDSSDNRLFGENVIYWLISNLAPIAIIDSPEDGGGYTSSYLISFNGSSSYDPDGYIVDYSWTSSLDGKIGSSATFDAVLSLGTHILSLQVTDNVGKMSSTSITLTIYAPNKPDVSISSHDDFDVVNGIVTISGNATDSDGIVQTVEVRLEDGNWTQAIGTESWNYELDTTLSLDGVWEIQARSIDNDDLYSNIASVTLTVDNTPPEIISGPKASSVTDSRATIEWETNEPSDGTVEYGEGSTYSDTESDSKFVKKHRIVLDDLSHSTTYNFRVKSKDEAGNIQDDYGEGTFTTNPPPDFTSPIGIISNPSDGDILKGEVTITVDASDEYGITKVEFYINDNLEFTDYEYDYFWLWDTADGTYSDDQYSIKIVVKDTNNNEASDEISVTLDNEVIPPEIVKMRVNPSTVENKESTEILVTVEIYDPEGAFESVVIDLSSLDGSSEQKMYDDGSHGDEVEGDDVYSVRYDVPAQINPGEKSLAITLTFRDGGIIETSLSLNIISSDDGISNDDDSKTESGIWPILLALLFLIIAVIISFLLKFKKRRPKIEFAGAVPVYQMGIYENL